MTHPDTLPSSVTETPETDSDRVSGQVTDAQIDAIYRGLVEAGVSLSFPSTVSPASAMRAALRRSTATDKPGVREAALEEAAKVAETITQDGDYDLEPEATVAASVAGKQIAAAIRSLRTSPPASPTEAGEATTSLPDPALTDAIEWLETNQRQLDQDGIEVAVSRQALEQVLAALKDRSHV